MSTDPDDLIGRLGFSTASLPGFELETALRTGIDLGFRCAELLAFDGYRHTAGDLAGRFFDCLSPGEIDRLAASIEPFDHVAVHAPFWDVVPFSPNPTTREAAREQLRRTLKVSGMIGVETVTTHVIPRLGYALEEFRPEVVAFYRELGDVAAAANATVTIETGYPLEIEVFTDLLRQIDHPAVGANVDVGHLRGLLTEQQRTPEALGPAYNALLAQHVRSLGKLVYHVHLHDVQAEGVRDHRESGTGVIDYVAFFRLLMQLDYTGLVAFELEEAEPEAALHRSREVVVEAIRAARPVT